MSNHRAELLDEAADALMRLLDDTQHKEHPDCEDGYCPVRDARVTLAKLQAFRSASSSLILEREEAGGETSDSVHLAVPTNGPESHGEAA